MTNVIVSQLNYLNIVSDLEMHPKNITNFNEKNVIAKLLYFYFHVVLLQQYRHQSILFSQIFALFDDL